MPDKTELINCPICSHKVSKEYCFVCPNCNYQVKEPTPEDKAQRHITAENETCNDFKKTEEELLTEIHEESLDRTRLPSETVSRTMARFAALLVLLSKKADKANKDNIKSQNRLTWVLIFLTVTILFFTIIMSIIMFFQFFQSIFIHN